MVQQVSEYAATGLVVVITYFTIVMGELVPKRLGQINPESLARLVARPMLLSGPTQLVLRAFGVKNAGPARM